VFVVSDDACVPIVSEETEGQKTCCIIQRERLDAAAKGRCASPNRGAVSGRSVKNDPWGDKL